MTMSINRTRTPQKNNPDAPQGLEASVISKGLRTSVIGQSIQIFSEIESTNAEAASLASQGAPEGTVVIAESQTRGRGRMGREWISPPNRNLYLSVILRPKRYHDRLGNWTLSAALAAAKAIGRTTGLEPDLKWPNDLRIKKKKIAGLLIETLVQGKHVKNMVLGIGINVNMSRMDFPEPLRSTASSLSEVLGHTVDRNRLCRMLLQELDSNYKKFLDGDFGTMLEGYRKRSETLNQRVRVQVRQKTLEGIAVDFSEDGALLLKCDNGILRPIYSEEIVHLREDLVTGN